MCIILYCDESGNTGDNFLDSCQPVYVLAGWIVPFPKIEIAETSILDFEDRLSDALSEPKSSKHLKTKTGLILTRDLFRHLGKLSCFPIFSVAEKKFVIATKIVETFLDPNYNDLINHEFSLDAFAKQEAAEVLYRLPWEKLENFALAYKIPDSNKLLNSAIDIARFLSLSMEIPLSEMVLGCRDYIEEVTNSEIESRQLLPNKAMAALNTPTALQFFSLAEDFGLRKLANIKIVHDETPYQQGLTEIFNEHKNAEPERIKLPDISIYFGFQSLQSIEFVKSNSNPLIRSADFLAGSIYQYLSAIIKEQPLHPLLIDLAAMILPLSNHSARLGWMMASNSQIDNWVQPYKKRPKLKWIEKIP